MSPEARRIAIAEACGWKRNEPFGDLWYHQDSSHCQDGKYCDEDDLPDYLNDLNACAEFSSHLTAQQQGEYIEHLSLIVNGKKWAEEVSDVWRIAEATAAQRAEAFLRTIGKQDGKTEGDK